MQASGYCDKNKVLHLIMQDTIITLIDRSSTAIYHYVEIADIGIEQPSSTDLFSLHIN
jgi:hypothetical protein